MAIKNAKCSQLFALLAEKIRWFLSNRLVTNLYTAASVMYPSHVTTIKLLIVETFPGSKSLRRFSVVTKKEKRGEVYCVYFLQIVDIVLLSLLFTLSLTRCSGLARAYKKLGAFDK